MGFSIPVTSKSKLHLATALFLLALAVLLGPRAWRTAPSGTAAEDPLSTRSAFRSSSPTTPRPARDFATFAKLSAAGEIPKLTHAQIEAYLEAQHRSAASLVAAFRISGDEALLREAMEKFPHDPLVLLTSLRNSEDPAKRLEILATLKQVDPGNGLGYYLSARALFDLGKSGEAMAELAQAAGKPVDDKTLLVAQNTQEAYLAAGMSPLEAKMISLLQVRKGDLIALRTLADSLQAQRKSDAAAGDDAAVRSSREIQTTMVREIQKSGCILDVMVAFALEKGMLQEIDTPEARARLEEIDREKKSISADTQKIQTLMQDPVVPEDDWILYLDRVKSFGEKAANDWIIAKYPDR
jgi:hypothetical protein